MAKLSTILGSAFDSSAVEPQAPRDGEPLPAGLYTAEITNAEVKELKSGNGVGLALEFTVIDGPHARRKVWQNLNIKHSSEQAEQIGQSQLSALCRAVGINGKLEDSDELFQKIVAIRTKVRPAQGDYGPRAEVAGYEPAGAASHASAPAAAPSAAAARPAAPWKRKAA
jgi:hypothetical protein